MKYRVWNVTLGYAEHIGTLAECRTWLRNVRDLGIGGDEYQIVDNRGNEIR